MMTLYLNNRGGVYEKTSHHDLVMRINPENFRYEKFPDL